MSHKRTISRRKFLGEASCAAIGATTLFSTLFNLKSLNAAASFNSTIMRGTPEDYRALVCIQFSGGIDSFNMLVPNDNVFYNQYANTRSNMALNRNALLNIHPKVPDRDGRTFGLHPSLVHMQQLFDNEKLAFVSNVGTLIRPMNKIQYYDNSVPAPLGLYSHSDQQQQWQTGLPHERSSIGWGGKMADLMISANPNNTISMNISLAGSNVFQSGENTVEYSLHPEYGSEGIYGYNSEDWLFHNLQTAAINGMVNPVYKNVFKNTYRKTIKTAIEGSELFATAIENAPVFNVPFEGDHYFTQSMQMVAKTISGRNTLNVKRQIFFVEFGGWDMHDELLNNQEELLSILDSALHSFYSALEQMGVANQVTTFTLSEFSRTLTSNGNGTDHAWGANVFVMGGDVNGKNIYGQYPSLALTNNNFNNDTNPQEVGGGVLIPTISTDEYFAELALWYGLPSSDLALIFPNIGHFYTPMSGQMPIGFLNL